MSTLADLMAMGEKLGYTGFELSSFVKAQQDLERDARIARKEEAEARKAESEARKAEIEKQIELEKLKAESLSSDGSEIKENKLDGWSSKLIPKFDETEVNKFFIAFEKVATQLEWKRELWAVIAQSVFIGKAQVAYAALNNEDSKDYEIVKSAVLAAYQLVPEAYRQKFRTCIKKSSQSYVEFAKEKEILFTEWLRASEVSDFDSLKELILVEDFKNGLPKEIRTHIEEFDIGNLESAAKASDWYLLSHQLSRGSSMNGSSNKRTDVGSGSKAKSSSSTSPKKSNKQFKPISQRVCYGCGKVGHLKAQCTSHKPAGMALVGPKASAIASNVRQGGISDELYKGFGEFVSFGEVCTSPSDVRRRVVILRDTGAVQSCILRSLVPNELVLRSDKYVLLGGFPRTVTSCPLVEFFVDSCEFRGKCLLAVVDALPIDGVDCVIGNDIAGKARSSLLGQGPRQSKGCEGEKVIVFSKPINPITRSQSSKEPVSVDEPVDLDSLPDVRNELVHEVARNNKLPFDRKSLVLAQQDDVTLKSCFDEAITVQELKDLSRPSYVVDNGLLYHFSRPLEASTEDREICKRIVVPESCRNMVMEQSHESLWAGHLGITKTLNKIKKHFFWPSLKKDVIHFCKTCHHCQLVGKPNQLIPKAPLQPIPAIEDPFSHIVIDIVGPLPRTSSGFEYILTVMDRTTRFPEAYPLRSIKSKSVIKYLLDFFARYGLPRVLQSDRGSNFSSREFERQMTEWGIKHVFATPYHPESQGILERFHLTLKNALTKYCYENSSNWDVNIPYVLFAVRSAPSETLGFTPFEMVYGHNVRGPLEVIREQWEGEDIEHNSLDYLLAFKEKISNIRKWAETNLGEAQVKMKNHFDKNSKLREFRVGDKVLVLLPIPGMFKAKYTGPGEVVAKINDLNYVVTLPGRRKKEEVFHINLLRPYLSRTQTASFVTLNVTPTDLDSSKVDSDWKRDNSKVIEHLPSMLTHLDSSSSQDILNLVKDFPEIFKDTPGKVNCIEHDVVLVPDAKPIRQAPYRLNPMKAAKVREEVKYMRENNLIVPSDSPWGSPVVLVPKESGDWRLCFDYRKVNDVTIPDSFPLPRIEDCIDKVGSARFVSKFDLLKGYWQVPLSARARKISAFITPEGLFECLVMPFGFRNAASTFQRLMWHVTNSLEGCVVYLDDIIIYSDTWNEHLDRIRNLFQNLKEAGLVVNLGKCEFGKGEVTYLGHKIGQGHVRPKEANVEAILNFPVPSNKKNVRQFLGLCGYYRRFVPGFSEVAAPLSDLLKCKSKFVWSEQCQESFNKLKAVLSSYPILASPNFDKPFQLMVDASDVGVGSVLLQEFDGCLHPIAYFSRKLNESQTKYSTIEKETLALILSLQHFEIYVTSSSSPLKVYTDHNPLKFIKNFHNKNRRLSNWSLILQEYNVEIAHIKGKDNVIADALSRNCSS